MKIKSNAKINLGLYITGLDDKNYHLLDATMLPISLYDDIEIEISDKDEVIFINQEVPNNNTVTKVIKLMKEYYKFNACFKVIINKNIPSGAGLGGGSSNAAFVMKAIVELLKLNPDEELFDIALKVGADVPFFLINKPCRMQGIGEILTPFEVKNKHSFLLIKPKFGINTVEAYKKYDEINKKNKSIILEVINSLKEGKIINEINNDLFESAKNLQPEFNSIVNEINKLNPKLLTMSGSGSTLVIYDDIDKLKTIEKQIKKTNFELCRIVEII